MVRFGRKPKRSSSNLNGNKGASKRSEIICVKSNVDTEVRAAVECVFVRRVEEVVAAVFGGSVGRIGAGFGAKKGIEGEKVWVESRL